MEVFYFVLLPTITGLLLLSGWSVTGRKSLPSVRVRRNANDETRFQYVGNLRRDAGRTAFDRGSVTEQVAYGLRNGIRIARIKRKHWTTRSPYYPPGLPILRKRGASYPVSYKGAEMPLHGTGAGGISLHAGRLAGLFSWTLWMCPASAGICKSSTALQ